MIQCFCAAHFEHEYEIPAFFAMLRSWKAQTTKCHLYVALSAANTDLLDKADEAAVSYKAYVFKVDGSELEKYEYLLKRLDMLHPHIILFTSQSGLWNPRRVEICAREVAFDVRVVEAQPLVFNRNAGLAHFLKFMNAVAVDEGIQSQELYNRPAVPLLERFFVVNYELKYFFDNLYTNVLINKRGTEALQTFLSGYRFKRVIHALDEPTQWLYYVRPPVEDNPEGLLEKYSYWNGGTAKESKFVQSATSVEQRNKYIIAERSFMTKPRDLDVSIELEITRTFDEDHIAYLKSLVVPKYSTVKKDDSLCCCRVQ